MKKYLFIPLTSYGYLFPSIKLGHMLLEQGHDILFATTVRYEDLLKLNGIPVFGVLNQRTKTPFLNPASWFCDPNLSETVTLLCQLLESYKPDAIVSNPLGVAAMLLAEKYEIPLISIGFTEYLYPGIGEVNETKEWRLKEITDHYNANRVKLSLPPIELSAANTPLTGDLYFIRNIPELDDERVLPNHVSHIGGFYWEPTYKNPRLSKFIANGKKQGRKLVYMQIGRLFGDGPIWNVLLETIEAMPYEFVIDLGRADYVKNGLNFPENVFVSPFIPLGSIAEDVSFVMCSGQSTSVISAIVHGKPILSIPHSANAIEFTAKVQEKKLGLGILDSANIKREYLTEVFEEMQDPSFTQSVQYYQGLFAEVDEESLVLEKIAALV